MVHELRLNKEPFESIKAKTKTIEMRLYDDKRKKIQVGDIIIFSLRPTKRSILPLIAASVRTLVVSWNDAADKKLSVARAALVIPKSVLATIAGLPPLERTSLFSSRTLYSSNAF